MSSGKYSRFVPSIFKESKDEASFMERYLRIFEDVLNGNNISVVKDDESDRLDLISGLFHPGFNFLFDSNTRDFVPALEEIHFNKFKTFFSADMDEFLGWLAGWVGLSLKENWDIHRRREVIAKIIPLYRIRGTKTGLEKYLKICTGYEVEIIEEIESFQVGIISHVGKDTIIGGNPPYHFIVNVILPGPRKDSQNKRLMIKELIDEEKPIHTNYTLNIEYIV
jgi:phage tail-like protein